MIVPLSQIHPDQQVRVVWIASPPFMAKRLRDLGFAESEALTCVLRRPRRGMAAYLVCGSIIALRYSTASEIFVETMPAERKLPANT